MKNIIWIVACIVMLASCEKEDQEIDGCGEDVLLSTQSYENNSSDAFVITSVVVDEDGCLSVTISASGCDGDTWETDLIAEENVVYTDPPRRNIRLTLENSEECLAVITKTFSFNVDELKADSGDMILLITGFNGGITIN